MFGLAYFLREIQVIGFRKKEVLNRLPRWPLPRAITGSDGDYGYIKAVQKKMEQVVPFWPKWKWDWLPKRIDPWMIITQVYYMLMFNFCG